MKYFNFCYSLFLWVLLVIAVLSECPFPKKRPKNGIILWESRLHYNWTMAPENYVLRFKCTRGYTLQGANALLCSSNQWTDELPTCRKLQCDDPPAINNGSYVLQTGVHDEPTMGSIANYSCNKGFKLENETDSFLECYIFKDSAEWKGNRPKCVELVSCPDPGISPDGSREGACCFTGSKVRYSCDEDFNLEGPEEIECLPDGEWSARRPFCRPQDEHCDLPPPIPHGIAEGDKAGDFYRADDEVEILCDPGFRYAKESIYAFCNDTTNKWSEEFSECVEAFCEVPPPLANGTIPEIANTNLTSFPYDFELTYVCDEGFRLIGGDSWRTCDSRGWTGEHPRCEVIKCPNPGDPDNGIRVGSNFSIGEKVTFKCFTGFTLLGSFERYCRPNGQWTGEVARCDLPSNYCPNPGIPDNGAKSSSNYDMGEKISFRCHEGYSLVGSEIRECLHNRTWSGTEIKCVGKNDYDNSAQVRDTLREAVAEKRKEQKEKIEKFRRSWSVGMMGRTINLNYAGRLVFYFVFDTSGSVKKGHFKESVNLAKAIVKKVGVEPNGARVGALTFSSRTKTWFLPVDYSTTEQVLLALDRINHTGGGTSTTSALADLREEVIPLTQEVFKDRDQKSIVFILTDGKANMGGDPKGEADLLKQEGAEIYCVGITHSPVLDSLYKIASLPFDEHVFILKDYLAMSDIIQKLTEGEVDYSKCGLGQDKTGKQTSRGKIAGGGKTKDPWPWMAALYLKQPELVLTCGGSIVQEKFILTAAHCLYSTDGNEIEAHSIIVKLGLTNVKNETDLQEFEIETYFVHPSYVHKKHHNTYDFDIALLKLQRPIEFNNLVRPICLPEKDLNPDTKLYKPGQYAVATGWGHKDVVGTQAHNLHNVNWQIQEDLKEVTLPIQTDERCRQSIKDHERERYIPPLTNNMFCVGDGEGGNDTCKGDSGGPLMQSRLNKEGFQYWTQIGIVSWGIGCGAPNTYGVYSHVQRLLDWVNDVLKNIDDNI